MTRLARNIQGFLVAGAAVCLLLAGPALAAGPDADTAASPAPVVAAPSPAAPTADAGRTLFPKTFNPAPAPRPVLTPTQVGESSGWGSLTSMAAPLAVVVAVIFIAATIFRKVMHKGGSLATMLGGAGRAPSGILEVLGRYPIARGQTLVLLKVDQRILLLSQAHPTRHHPGAFATLSELNDPVDVASILMKVSETESTGPAGRFNDLLRSFDAEGDQSVHPVRRGLRHIARRLRPAEPTIWQEAGSPVAEIELTEPGDLRSLRSQLQAMRPVTAGARG